MKFNMSLEDNYASFIDEITGVAVFVDSFDNKNFEVRIGTVSESKVAGFIAATTVAELNEGLESLYNKYQGEM